MTQHSFSKAIWSASLGLSFLLGGCGAKEETQNTITEPRLQSDLTERPETQSETITYTAPGPVKVKDAKEGQALATERREATPIDPRSPGWRFPARVEPITWDYGTCLNARTLIPSPLEGWGLLNDMSVGEWPIDDDNARLVLTKAGGPHDPPSLGRSAANDSTAIYISSGTATVKALQDMFSNEQLRPTFFTTGPYNYPVRKGVPGALHQEALLGPYRVLIDGNNADDGEYFRQIIQCAIKSGLVAEGVDPTSLRDTP